MTVHDEPLSWLMLERYALGELSASAMREVEARLAVSEQDRACLASIRNDDSALPPLPALAPVSPTPRRNLKVVSLVAASLALAAAALLMVRAPQLPPSARHYDGVKGGDVALALLSERVGRDPTHYTQNERFKLLVTCPVGFDEQLKVLVFQGEERFAPLAATPPSCGNLVPWPGAFALTGTEPATVCVVWASARDARSLEQLGEDAVCTTLRPAP